MILLDSVSYFAKEYLDFLLLIFLIKLCTNIKQKSFYFFLLLLSFPITLLSITDALLAGISLVLVFLVLRIFYWRQNKEDQSDELLGFLFSLAIYAIVPLISSIIVSKITGLKLNTVNEGKFLLILLNSFINWTISIFSVFFVKKKILSRNYTYQEKKIFVLQLSSFLLSIYLIAELLRTAQLLGTLSIIMVVFLIIQFVFTLIYTTIALEKDKERTEINGLKEQMVMMDTYTKEVESNYQKLRKFRHDYKNLLLGLQTNSDLSIIDKKYLNQMIDYSHQMIDTSIMRFSGIRNLNLTSIKSLLITKLSLAEQMDLNISFECMYPVNKINMDEVNLVRILGILIDNAIEAAVESKNRKVIIIFLLVEEGIEITISNSFSGKISSLANIDKHGYSTKGNGRGIGLSTVKEILMLNVQAEIVHYAAEELFVTTLIVRNGD